MNKLAIFMCCLLVAGTFAYENPKKKVAEKRSRLQQDYIGDDYVTSGYIYESAYDVVTINHLKKDDPCYYVQPNDGEPHMKCALDLICTPTDTSACITKLLNNSESNFEQSKACIGTCKPFGGAGTPCFHNGSSYVSFPSCKSGYDCNMNKNGEVAMGECAEFFSVGEGGVASDVMFCKFGLVQKTDNNVNSANRTSQICVAHTEMKCNASLVGERYCQCKDNTFDCLNAVDSYYACIADDGGAPTCKFLASSCESIIKDFYNFNRFRASIEGIQIGYSSETKAYIESSLDYQRRALNCFDSLTYEYSNPANDYQ